MLLELLQDEKGREKIPRDRQKMISSQELDTAHSLAPGTASISSYVSRFQSHPFDSKSWSLCWCNVYFSDLIKSLWNLEKDSVWSLHDIPGYHGLRSVCFITCARIEKRFQSISLLSYSLRFFFRRIYFLFHSLSFLVLKTFWGIRFSARLPVLILRIKKLRWNFCLLFRLFFPKRRFALNLSLCLLKWSCLLFLFLLHFLPQEERRWLTTMIVILLMSKQRPGIHKECHSLSPKMQERDWYYRLNGWVGIWWGWGMKETEKAKEKRRWREKELWCKMRFNKHCLSVLRWWWCFSCSSI